MIVVIVVGIIASLLAAMKSQKHRFLGFCGFFCTNICWIIYGVVHVDYNIILQFGCFLVISSIGLWSNKGFLMSKEEAREEANENCRAHLAARSEYIGHLEARIKELEAQVAELNCQLEACRKQRSSLRKQQEAQRRATSRRYRDQADYIPYADDDYDGR